MADDKIALSIEIEADRAQMSLEELEKGFAGLQEKLKGTKRNTEEGREAFKKLSTQMAQASGDIKNLELGFEGLDREQITSEFVGMAGGIGDVTASLVLMGGENKTIEQMGASIEKAMAISMGIKGVMEGAAAANKLYNNSVKAKAIVEKVAAAGTWILNTANKALNTTLKMNPIGLILIAITAVVGAIIYFKDSIMGLIDIALKPFQWAIDAVVDALQWLGIMESDSAIATREAEEAKSKAAIDSARKRVEETEKLIEAHKKLTDSMVADMDWEIRKRKANGEDTTKIEIEKLRNLIALAKEERKLQQRKMEDLTDEFLLRAKLNDLNAQEFADGMEAIGAAAEATLAAKDVQLKGEQDLEIAIIELKKEGRDKRTAIKREETKETEKINAKEIEDQKKKDEKLVALEKDRIKLLEDLEAKAIDDKNVRALAELENTQKREQEALKEKFGQDTELLKALTTEQELAMDTLIADIEQEARENKAALDKEARDKDLEDTQIALDKKKAQRDKDFELATAAIGALSALNKAATDTALLNAAGDEEKKEKIRKASFEREKKLNIAMALINGAQAVLAGFAQGGLPMAIVAGVTAAAQLAAIVATTYQGGGSVKEVDKTAPTPDGAGAGGAGAQINAVTNTSTILGNQQVYVTETDITTTQNNVSVIEESATF